MIDHETQKQREQALQARTEAKRRLHWHLSRAAAACANSDEATYLGEWIDRELREVAKARSDWDAAHELYWKLFRDCDG